MDGHRMILQNMIFNWMLRAFILSKEDDGYDDKTSEEMFVVVEILRRRKLHGICTMLWQKN